MRPIARRLARLFMVEQWHWGTYAGELEGFIPTAEQINDTITQCIGMIELEGVSEVEVGRLVVRKYELGYDVLVNFGDIDDR